jgi:hypothetical protein
MAVAEALERAAATFTNMVIEHKQKDDALSYSNAKNEYLIASIEEQDKLADDLDFATHGERYNAAMKGHYERLLPTVKSERDRQLFDAEARLHDARGNVDVGNNARVKEIDWNLARFSENMTAAERIVLAAPDSKNALEAMTGILEQGEALLQKGFVDPTEHETTMRKFVSTISERRLIAMDGEEREILLERSILMSKSRGGKITREEIMAGEGSGSIADFIPLDVRVNMLEETKKANKHDATWKEAYGVFDEITEEFTDPINIYAEFQRRARDLEPDVRSALRSLVVDDRNDKGAIKSAVQLKIMQSVGELMRTEGWRYGDVPSSELNKLSPAMDVALQEYSRRLSENVESQGFREATRWIDDPKLEGERSYAYWSNLTDAEKKVEELQTPLWYTALTVKMHTEFVDEQDDLRSEKVTVKTLPGGMTNVQMVTSALVRAGHIPQTGRDIEDYESYQQLLYQFDRATQAAQDEKKEALTNSERNKILGEILAPRAFTDHYGWWFGDKGWPEEDELKKVPIFAMSVSQRESARLNWDNAGKEQSRLSSAGIASTYKQDLELMAKRLKVKPSRDQYERAYFALKYGWRFGWTSEYTKRRLLGTE